MRRFGTKRLRALAGALAGLSFFSIAGCGGSPAYMESNPPNRQTVPPPIQQPMERRQGLSTKQKVMLVAGAAALYYLYQKHKNRQGEGPQGRYYRSRNGRVYYRDLKTGQYQWVDPPQQPIRVPAEEYERYTGRSAEEYGDQVIRQAPPGW